MFVGLLGKEPDVPLVQNKKYSVRVVQPVLNAMEVRNLCIVGNGDIANIAPAVDLAYAESQSLIVLFGRRVMMLRTDCLKEIAKLRGDALVVAVYSTAFEWIGISPHPLNYLSVGAMGQASPSALGFAISLPDRKVIVLDGDGSLLMNLGSLVTIAGVATTNLTHFVVQNGCYEANGAHPIPGQDKVYFAGFARAAGYRSGSEFSDLDKLRTEMQASFKRRSHPSPHCT